MSLPTPPSTLASSGHLLQTPSHYSTVMLWEDEKAQITEAIRYTGDSVDEVVNKLGVMKVALPIFFLYFSSHFLCLKCLLCYHVTRHVIPPSLSATCATIVTHLQDCQSHCRP